MVGIGIGIGIGARLFAPRLNRVRSRLGVASPLEFLAARYNVTTQQVSAWSGSLLKIVDVGAKWAAIATLLSVFTGLSLGRGILITGITGATTAVYCQVGGRPDRPDQHPAAARYAPAIPAQRPDGRAHLLGGRACSSSGSPTTV